MKFTPRSMAASMIRSASASSNSSPQRPPTCQVPREIAEMSNPVLPSLLYSIMCLQLLGCMLQGMGGQVSASSLILRMTYLDQFLAGSREDECSRTADTVDVG